MRKELIFDFSDEDKECVKKINDRILYAIVNGRSETREGNATVPEGGTLTDLEKENPAFAEALENFISRYCEWRWFKSDAFTSIAISTMCKVMSNCVDGFAFKLFINDNEEAQIWVDADDLVLKYYDAVQSRYKQNSIYSLLFLMLCNNRQKYMREGFGFEHLNSIVEFLYVYQLALVLSILKRHNIQISGSVALMFTDPVDEYNKQALNTRSFLDRVKCNIIPFAFKIVDFEQYILSIVTRGV